MVCSNRRLNLRDLVPWAAAFCVATVFAPSARAGLHLWAINEVYSNSSGTLQFIELRDSSGGQNFVNGGQLKACVTQQRFDHAANFKAMLQTARRMECQFSGGLRFRVLYRRAQISLLGADDLAQIARQFRYARSLARVGPIVAQQMSVLLHHRAAAACRYYYGLRARLNVRPPGVDVAFDKFQCCILRIHVMR